MPAQNGGGEAQKIAVAKRVLGQAKVDFGTAFTTAQQKVPEGKPLIARTELIGHSARYGFYFLDGEKVREVEVDASTGEVIKVAEKREPEKDRKFTDAMKALQGAKVSFREAMDVGAIHVKGGKLIEVEMELNGGRAIVELEYLVDERLTRVRIDAKDVTSVTVK